MKLLKRSFDFTFFGVILLSALLFSHLLANQNITARNAKKANATSTETVEDKDTDSSLESSDSRYVTIFDKDNTIQLKTTATTVGELLRKARISTSDIDIIEPDKHAHIDSEKFYINIYRARPVLVVNGNRKKIIETASYDIENIVKMAGFTLFDGDSVEKIYDQNLILSGVSSIYNIKHSGGSVVTAELTLPAPEEKRHDPSLKLGETKLLSPGEDGRKAIKYDVKYQNGKESRILVEEKVITSPKPRIIAVNTKSTPKQKTTPLKNTDSAHAKSATPTSSQSLSGSCAGYVRAAGVSEEDLPIALDLIHKESKCNPFSKNPYSGAYGIPQALPGNKMASAGSDWQTNPVTQIRWMDKYVKTRYGGWRQALEFWHCIGTCRGVNKRSTWY